MREFWLYLPARQLYFCTCLATCGHVAALSAPLAVVLASRMAEFGLLMFHVRTIYRPNHYAQNKKFFAMQYPGKHLARLKSSILSQPLMIGIQPNLKLTLLYAKALWPNSKKYFVVQCPGYLLAPLKSSISQPLMIRIQPNLKLKLQLA